jgi:hypothetical protein
VAANVDLAIQTGVAGLWTEFISELCKTYQKLYDTNSHDSEMHEEVLGIMATAIGKAEAGFFRDNESH